MLKLFEKFKSYLPMPKAQKLFEPNELKISTCLIETNKQQKKKPVCGKIFIGYKSKIFK